MTRPTRKPLILEAFITPEELHGIINRALNEDLGPGDITVKYLFDEGDRADAIILSKSEGTLCGLPVMESVFKALDSRSQIKLNIKDGTPFRKGDILAEIRGWAAPLLSAERTALNFLQRLSGIATHTSKFVEILKGSETKLLDTRKTTPGLRRLEKYAVACGGATNHRIGLFDAILIKDNHLAICGGIEAALKKCFSGNIPSVAIEVEVKDLAELDIALRFPVNRIMLDNFSPELIEDAITLIKQKGSNVDLEASGGINLDSLARYAETGIDYISVGAVTHSAKALDISMEVR